MNKKNEIKCLNEEADYGETRYNNAKNDYVSYDIHHVNLSSIRIKTYKVKSKSREKGFFKIRELSFMQGDKEFNISLYGE